MLSDNYYITAVETLKIVSYDFTFHHMILCAMLSTLHDG